MAECDICDRDFDSDRGLAIHKSKNHSKPWHNKELLKKLYRDYGVTSEKMADYWGCDPKTVRNNLKNNNIETRGLEQYHRKEKVQYTYHDQGYRVWIEHYGEDRGKVVYVHRLLAMSEYGFEAVKDKHIHHENGIPWDNRPDNIEPLTPKQHMQKHKS